MSRQALSDQADHVDHLLDRLEVVTRERDEALRRLAAIRSAIEPDDLPVVDAEPRSLRALGGVVVRDLPG
jgi:hypothetical protein